MRFQLTALSLVHVLCTPGFAFHTPPPVGYADSDAAIGPRAVGPNITLISPYNTPLEGWTFHGSIAFAVDAKDTTGIKKVDFYVDDVLSGSDTTYPYGILWNTRPLAQKNYTLKAVATNTAGVTATVSQVVTVAAPLVKANATGSVITSGLLPNITPAIPNINMRDTSITRDNAGVHYLTGTGSDNDAWKHNEGIQLWKSTDLKTWSYIGLIWSFERDGAADEKAFWDKSGQPFRVVWAPEISFFNNNFYIVYSLATKGSRLLRSTTGKPEGPYQATNAPGGFLFGNIDGALYNDTNTGAGYLCYESGSVFHMNSDWTATTGSVVRENTTADEGCMVFHTRGKYYLSAAKFMDNGRYSSYVGISDDPLGPYSQWKEAIPSGGHNTYFEDCAGGWWGTFFGNDVQAPWREQPAIVKIEFNADNTFQPSKDQTPPKC